MTYPYICDKCFTQIYNPGDHQPWCPSYPEMVDNLKDLFGIDFEDKK